MKRKKRWFAGLLSAVLILTLLPVSALAIGENDGTVDGTETIETANNENDGEGSEDNSGEGSSKLSDNTDITSTNAITRAQMVEMVYEHESLKSDIDTMAGGGTEPSFDDITVSENGVTQDQHDAIVALYKAKIISGTSATTFNPSGTVTRGEFAVVLWRATGSRSNKTAMTATFTDQLASWYAPAVNCFYGAGLVSGTASGAFNGGNNISVKEVNAFLSAYATNKNDFISKTDSGSTTRAEMTVEFYEKFQPELSKLAVTRTGEMPFTDLSGCTEEQVTAIQFFYERGIISGTSETTFHPHTPVSNFQIAALLQRCATYVIPAETTETVALFSVMPLAEENQSPFEFLAAQGVTVGDAASNPNAPALTATLTAWRDGLVPNAPAFTPASGTTFTDSQAVTISAADGTAIYYTTDGSGPVTSSTQYSEALTLSDTTTVKAIAVKNNLVSEIAAATYTKQTQELEQPALSITASKTSLSGGGTVTLTTSKAADSVTCSDTGITVTGSGTSWTATLPNSTATYTFTAAANQEQAACTVSVTRYTSGGGSSSGGSSSSNTTTQTTTNPDGSKTTTVTNKKTGTVTETTKNKDGSTLVVETKKDGTVTTTETTKNGVEVRTVNEPGEDVTATVTIPKSAGTSTVTVPADVTPGTVAVDAKTGEIVKLSVPTEGGMVVKLDGSTELVLEDRSKDFDDAQNHWAGDSIDFVVAHGMFSGTSKTTFAPDNSMTRAMLMTVLARFDGQDTNGGATWYERGMEWAKDAGVSDGTNPNGAITREQLAAMLYRYAGSPSVDDDIDHFADADKVSGYATDAMRWAVSSGVINGMGDGTLAPQGNATRAQVSAMLMRFCTNLTK